MEKLKHLVSSDDFTKENLLSLLTLGDEIYKDKEKFLDSCKGKVLATLFFEPSTRTRLSFETAMLRLGGSVITVSDKKVSSTTKGESLADTIRTVSSYADIIAMRNPHDGAANLAKNVSKVPFINAGDGANQHPTQTLTDLLTIYETKKSLENLTVAFCGDLKFGRTVHSLVKTLSKFDNNKFIFISPTELCIPEYIKMYLKEKNISFKEVRTIEEVIKDVDILYMTRVQKERFFNEADYVRLKDTYILDNEKMNLAKDDMIVLHPLPRVNEIKEEVDNDKRAKYFMQVHFGMIIRMALILKLFEV